MTSSLTPEENLDFVDENEEWAKIEKVMASLDTGLATDVLDDEGIGNILESGNNSVPVESVISNGEVQLFTNNSFTAYDRALTEWLSDQGLSKYEHFLISNGFDDLRFMGPEIMSEGDLIEIGMCDAEERARLIQASQQLTNNADGDQLTTSSSFKSVKHWLTSLNLSDYYETFAVHGCSALEDLLNIWDLQLTSVFHISRLGHRNRIMASINSFRSRANSKTSKSDSITNGCHDSHGDESQVKSAPQNICLTEYLLQRHHNLTSHNNNNSSSNIGEVSLFKDYSSLRSNKSGRSSASSTLRRQGEDQDSRRESKVITLEEVLRNCGVLEPTVKVMTPSSSSNASATSLPTSSSYKQLDLVLGGSNQQFGNSSFSVTYLGTVKLLSIERPDLARKCIEQIRQTPVESRRVVITISPKQVIFRDQISQEVLGAHDVSNVFCVCQDSELLEYFAFVTWDVIESVHFCHVFNAQYIKLSTDVVLALGKAFEVAFKIIQQEVAKQNGRSLSSSSTSPSSPSTAIATPATAALRPQTATEKKSTFV